MVILDDWEEALDEWEKYVNEDRYLDFYIEQVMYILFEAFRLWLVLDSVRKKRQCNFWKYIHLGTFTYHVSINRLFK
jgi:hypothetical protein